MSEKDTFRIGELAEEFNVTLRSLRFYEGRGLLNPERRGTTRFYSRKDRARLKLILLFKTLGFSLLEAKQMIGIYDHSGGNRQHLNSIEIRLKEQQKLLREQSDEVANALRVMGETLTSLDRDLNTLLYDAKCNGVGIH